MSSDLLAMIRRKNEAYKDWKTTKNIDDQHIFLSLHSKYHKAIKKAKADFTTKLFDDVNSPKDFWSADCHLEPSDQHIGALINESGPPLLSSGEKAKALNEQFGKNFNDNDYGYFDIPVVIDDGIDYSITTQFIIQEIRQLKCNCAPGEDGLTVAIIRIIAPSIIPGLTALFNCSISEGNFPSSWKLANHLDSSQLDVKLCGQRLSPVLQVKYLAVIFSCDMKFSYHISFLAKKTNSMVAALAQIRKIFISLCL